MHQDDPEKRIAELERQMAEASGTARADGAAIGWQGRADHGTTYARRRTALLLVLGAAGTIVVVALALASFVFGNVRGSNNNSGKTTSTTGLAIPDAVKPTAATVFSPDGPPDNPGQAGLAISGDPTVGWATDTYADPNPFPNFKSGVGLLLQLPHAIRLRGVDLDVPSTGTMVEIRSSRAPTPASLSDTTKLTGPILVKPGHNTIALPNAPTTSNVLVWITTLGTVDGRSRTVLSNITLREASNP
jgi:putative peptidoglycan lipid II flippase